MSRPGPLPCAAEASLLRHLHLSARVLRVLVEQHKVPRLALVVASGARSQDLLGRGTDAEAGLADDEAGRRSGKGGGEKGEAGRGKGGKRTPRRSRASALR
ncbi:hypothetical protein L7F22_036896 [Adiantum nelumboides]|nr:hypothetical protein [Adiantum nelumboides]